MNKKDKYLILLYARDFNRGRGIGYGEFFELRPNSMEEIDIGEMSNIFDKELRSKYNFLELGNRGRYILTKKGEEVLKKYLKGASLFEMNYLSRNFKQFGNNYRLKLIEGFIGSSLILILISLLAVFLEEKIYSSLFIQTTFIVFFFIFLGLVVLFGTTITFNFLSSLFNSIFKPFSKKIKAYPGIFLGISITIVSVAVIWIFLKLTSFVFEDILLELILAGIIGIVLKFRKIKQRFEDILKIKK